jgi:hypothetical protein
MAWTWKNELSAMRPSVCTQRQHEQPVNCHFQNKTGIRSTHHAKLHCTVFLWQSNILTHYKGYCICRGQLKPHCHTAAGQQRLSAAGCCSKLICEARQLNKAPAQAGTFTSADTLCEHHHHHHHHHAVSPKLSIPGAFGSCRC